MATVSGLNVSATSSLKELKKFIDDHDLRVNTTLGGANWRLGRARRMKLDIYNDIVSAMEGAAATTVGRDSRGTTVAEAGAEMEAAATVAAAAALSGASAEDGREGVSSTSGDAWALTTPVPHADGTAAVDGTASEVQVEGRRGCGEEGRGVTFIDPPLVMTEYACPKRSTYIANLTLEDYQPIAAVSRQKQCKSDLKGSYKRVVQWSMKHAQSNLSDGVDFKYRHAHGKDFGRMTSDSMMGIPRDIRGFVCISEETLKPILTDLDMDNCHPTILEWLCRKHGIVCDTLTDYVKNRQTHMDGLMESTGKSKDDVKSMFLAAVNSQGVMACSMTTLTPFYVAFDKQCKAIQQALMQLAEYRHLLPHAEEAANQKLELKKVELRRNRRTTNGLTANVAGSFINLILCTWENRFLGLACQTVSDMGLNVSVNNFDGMMIRGDHYPEGDDRTTRDGTICPALERALTETFGITMGWSMKRHSTTLIYSEDGLKLPYSKHAEPWLERICRVGSEYIVELTDGSTKTETARNLGDRLSAETAKCLLDFTGAPSWYCRTFAETLCRDPAMRTYEKADMHPDPSECPPHVYNRWKPMPCESWDVTQANPESKNVATFRNLVLILADRDDKVAAFVELWIAHMLHHPSRKPNAWLIFMSEEGAGKGTLVSIIMRLVGSAKVKKVGNVQRSLLGAYNDVVRDAFLVVLDEAKGKHLFDGGDELKNMITESTVTVHEKYVSAQEIHSYARWMVTVQPRSVPTKKGDRRGVISRCSDELCDKKGQHHLKDINHWIDESHEDFIPQFVPDIHAYLMTLKPPPVFQPDELPQTEVQRELQAANADVFESWIADAVERWLSCEGEPTGHTNQFGETTQEYTLRDYQGKCGSALHVFPELSMQHLFADFQMFAQRTNATKVIEGIRFPVFVSKFTICRWRKAFDWKPNGETFPKHKIKGVQHQCRRWDMASLARDLGIGRSGS